MATFPPAVLAHFAHRHGVAAHHELLAAGLTHHGIRALCRAENLIRVLKGVYRMPAVPFDHAARCAAVCAGHPEAVIALLHPGTVETHLTAKYAGNHPRVPPHDAAKNLLNVLDTLTPSQTGQFFDWEAKPILW